MKRLARLLTAGAIGATALISVPVHAASTLYVDDTCNPPANGTQADPYCTIQEAINAAANGDTIQVAQGVYNESVTVNKQLVIRGIQYGDNPLNGWLPENVESVVDPVAGPGFNITASNVTIDGFRITGATDGIVTSAAGSGYKIINNKINGNVRGINLNSNGVVQTRVQYNLFQGNGGDAIRSLAGLNNALVDHNNFSNHTNSAMTLDAGATHNNVTFTYNNSLNDATGANWYRATNSTIHHNTFTGFTATDYGAISLGGGNSNVSVHHNTISGRNSSGIVVVDYIGSKNSNLTIDHNNSSNNALDGIEIRAAATSGTLLISYNDANSNSRDGIRIEAGNTSATVRYNDMASNTEHDAHDNSVGTKTAGTNDTWFSNNCVTDSPNGLCP